MSAIGVTTELDTRDFVLMCRDLERISGKSFTEVLRSQVAAVLKFCISKTRSADRAGIMARALRFAKKQGVGIDHFITKKGSERFVFANGDALSFSNRSGHEGDVSMFDKSTAPGASGKQWHDMTNRRWSDARWARFQSYLAQAEAARAFTAKQGGKEAVAKALASRGLAKRSWRQAAEAAGVADMVTVPGYVANAKPQNGREYQNGEAKVMLEGLSPFIEVINNYPSVIRMDGQTLINYAIASRVKAFEREVEKGVFNDLKTRAERYPGLFVKPS